MVSNTWPELPPAAFDRQDGSDDLAFYAPPRLVTHIDEDAVAALSRHYSERVPPDGRVLDLMSSWVSHLPDDLSTEEVIGHGMNAEELAANPRLDRWFIADLNRDPVLPLASATLDAVLCCVGVQYLQHPVDVFAEVARTLRRGAPFIVSFSNRCFPTKAVRIWLALDMAAQAELVRLHLARAGFARLATEVLADGQTGDPLIAVTGWRS